MSGRGDANHLTWPPERFYWAVLDTSSLPRGGRQDRRLGYLFEASVPGQDAEHLHAVYRRLPGDGRYVACGLPHDEAEAAAAAALTLRPESLPSFIAEPVDPATLNLLTGRFAPPAVRTLQRRWIGLVALVVLLCAALATLGLERRVQAAKRGIEAIEAARGAVLAEVLGAEAGEGGQPASLRLTAERRRLEETRDADVNVSAVTNGAVLLASLLAHWPPDVHATTESVSVGDGSVTIRAAVPTMADAQQFADAFAPMSGWRLRQPRSEARRDDVAVTLVLEAVP